MWNICSIFFSTVQKEDKAFVPIDKGKGVDELEKRIREFDSGHRGTLFTRS